MISSIDDVRKEFPILQQTIHGNPLIYLDSAATAQKPQCVIEAERNFYVTDNAGVHRGAHELAARSTMAFEDARAAVAKFIHANAVEGQEEIVVTSGATGGLNLLAHAFAIASIAPRDDGERQFALTESDEIVVSQADHHSVLLPMQELARRTGATLRWIPMNEEGRITVENAQSVINKHTKIVAFPHIANTTGAITPVAEITQMAHQVGAYVIADMCQSIPHIAVDVAVLDVDFAVFSAHKMYAPTGVGFLYGKRSLLEALPPCNFGGSMVELAWLDRPAQYMFPPAKFEAGTQPVSQVVASGVAVQWLEKLGFAAIERHEHELTEQLITGMSRIDHVRILGPANAERRIGTVAFVVDDVHPHDVGQYLDAQGIAIRVGHHCAQPAHRHFGVYASNRVSCGVYNTSDDIDRFLEALQSVRAFFL